MLPPGTPMLAPGMGMFGNWLVGGANAGAVTGGGSTGETPVHFRVILAAKEGK